MQSLEVPCAAKRGKVFNSYNRCVAWRGKSCLVQALLGRARHGKSRQGFIRTINAGHGEPWPGKARHGLAMRGKARRGKVFLLNGVSKCKR